ncbi:glutathione S-transferase family protein [Burkholderia perseverans]|uniref:glutathione S-transferase family protein n=1 Tax=Burkholderia perseverans TaxID=2615214 RepID=UPI002467AD9F|nr:glutathione S-transferase family protein [Burkholderia perseverans]
MYHVHAFATPNSVKVPIALEELGVPYQLHAVNVRAGEQRHEAFLALNPNGKVPVLAEADGGFVLTESAAILVHLAERHGALLPVEPRARARTFEQLFVHASGLGPAFGRAGHFRRAAPADGSAYAIERFAGEAERQLRLLDRVLGEHRFASGDSYTIADIAHFGWLWRRGFAGIELTDAPNVARWYDEIAARAAVAAAIAKVEALAAAS